ncbi:MAG TPA: HD domain-containing phosphohydrolase [Candidatus Acidoferrum sp.]|jgi:putative nucleotidyltransferase with HDIG domain|nr:HD domain-containing phosphohydrolase [Candidatus Acidoferrum sp.]
MTPEIARQVRVVGADVARLVLAREGTAAHRTIAAEIVATQLCEHIATALEERDTVALEAWLDATFEGFGALTYLPSILENTALVLIDLGRTEGWLGDAEAMRPVTMAIGNAIRRPRPVAIESDGESIDDVDVTINNLLARLYEKDKLTGEHSQAVSLWCVRLARKLNLDDDLSTLVQRGGILHDIGKIATPIEILNAPRRLSDEERRVIELHPAEGAEIVVDVPSLSRYMSMVRSHHERLDGSGYPDRLAAADIPTEVRIVTVADCFNAMIGRRPYRPPLAPSVGLEELRRHCGTHFDPDVVEAMVQVVSEHRIM